MFRADFVGGIGRKLRPELCGIRVASLWLVKHAPGLESSRGVAVGQIQYVPGLESNHILPGLDQNGVDRFVQHAAARRVTSISTT